MDLVREKLWSFPGIKDFKRISILSSMKKEWAIQFVALVVYYLDYSLEIYRGRWEISQSFGKNLVFILFHGLLFLIVNYVLIPRFFYKRKITLFFFTLIALIVLFGIFEEGVLEKWLYPDSRGFKPNRIEVHLSFLWGNICSTFGFCQY